MPRVGRKSSARGFFAGRAECARGSESERRACPARECFENGSFHLGVCRSGDVPTECCRYMAGRSWCAGEIAHERNSRSLARYMVASHMDTVGRSIPAWLSNSARSGVWVTGLLHTIAKVNACAELNAQSTFSSIRMRLCCVDGSATHARGGCHCVHDLFPGARRTRSRADRRSPTVNEG